MIESDREASRTAASQLALGTAFVLAGQIAFVLTGYALHFFLSRSLDPIAYGTYGLILSVLSWVESALSSGWPWAVRKFAAAQPDAATSILRTGIKRQTTVGVLLFAGSVLLAPFLARALRDSAISPLLRLAFVDLLFMALFTVFQAGLNGLRLFDAQGLAMVIYSVVKLAASGLLVSAGLSVAGALVGNVIGTIGGWLSELWLLRRAAGLSLRQAFGREEVLSRKTEEAMLRFAVSSVPFTLASYFLTTVGLVGVKAWVQDGLQVAHYSAAGSLASAPRLVLVAFWLTLFPHLAGSIARGDRALTKSYIHSVMRFLALALVPTVFLVLGTSSQLITLLYPPDYVKAAPLLNVLLLSTALHTVYMVCANAIMAEGRTALALGIPTALVPLQLLATWYLTGHWGAAGAAAAAVATTGAAALVSAGYVLRRFSVQFPWGSVGRILLAGSVPFLLTRAYVVHGLMLIPYYLVLCVLYSILLLLLREVTPQEIGQLRVDVVRTLERWSAQART